MRKLTVLFILFSSSLLTNAQDNSILYSNKTLKANQTFRLDQREFKIWLEIEEEVIYNFINFFEVPQIFIDSKTKISGIASFQFNKKTKQYFLTSFESDQFIDLEKIKKAIENALNKGMSYQVKNLLSKEYKRDYTFYLPVIIKVENASEFMNENGQIVIEKSTPPLIKPDNIKSH